MSYSVTIVNSPNLWDSLSVYCLIIDSSHWLHPTALSLRMLFSLFLFLFLSCLTVFSSSLSLAFQELKSEPLSHGGLVHLFLSRSRSRSQSRSRPLSCLTLLSFFIFFSTQLSLLTEPPLLLHKPPVATTTSHHHNRSLSLSLSLFLSLSLPPLPNRFISLSSILWFRDVGSPI